jgi:hypothetical protein
MRHIPFRDMLILLAFPLIGAAVSLCAKTPYLISTFLFYVVPGIYVTIRFGHMWQATKNLLFSVVIAIPFTIVVDFIGTSSHVWYVPHTVFSTRFLGIIPWEDFFWLGLATYTIVALYAALLNEGERELAGPRLWYFVALASLMVIVFLVLLLSGLSEFFTSNSRYTYLGLGVAFFALPAGLFVWRFPWFLRRTAPLVAYFFYITILFELSATLLRQWVFTGTYLFPPLSVFGGGPIPYEELFFVGIVGPVATIAFYELCDDDLK